MCLARLGDGDPTEKTQIALGSSLDRARLTFWRDLSLGDKEVQGIRDALSGLLTAQWHGELRDKSGLLSMEQTQTQQLLDRTLGIALDNRDHLTFLFADLDHFKKVNDTFTQQKGDEVITGFSALLEGAAGRETTVLHRSGDEFLAVCVGSGPEEALAIARRISRAVDNHDFGTGTVRISSKIGIVSRESSSSLPTTFHEIEPLAEKAIKLPNGEKRRNVARFYVEGETPAPEQNSTSLDAAVSLVKAAAADARPFGSPWLNLLSETISTGAGSNHQGEVEAFLKWSKLTLDDRNSVSALGIDGGPFLAPLASPIDLLLATAHGVLRYALTTSGLDASQPSRDSLRIELGGDQRWHLISDPKNEILASVDALSQRVPTLIDLGSSPRITAGYNFSDVDARRAILVLVGRPQLIVPTTVFVDVITIDDRPVEGGGLPDFWEAALARVITNAASNPNLQALFVVGDRDQAPETASRLDSVDSWPESLEHLAYKTGLRESEIRVAVNQLRGKVQFLATPGDLSATAAAIHRAALEIRAPRSAPQAQQRRFLRRVLDTREFDPLPQDGIRVETAASAYPLVLDTLRKLNRDSLTRDQRGYPLAEVVGFKVRVANPSHDTVPAFYNTEQGSLEQYYQEQFVSETGLFREALDVQIEQVRSHIQQAIAGFPEIIATRRGILVVENQITAADELAPLGLVSIWIAPRFESGKARLRFSFTWRTVEALVGFPYSLYGSCRFAKDFVEKLVETAPPEIRKYIEIADLSYWAHSLHMFVDDYSENIARQIVDDASY